MGLKLRLRHSKLASAMHMVPGEKGKDLRLSAVIFWLIAVFLLLTLILMSSSQSPSQTHNSEMSCCILRPLEADVQLGTRGRWRG